MELVINPDGKIRCLYAETIELGSLGQVSITRGSYVEPNSLGNWLVDLAPVKGPILGPFPKRSDALHAEVEWLLANWLIAASP